MAEDASARSHDPDSLLVFSLATFHTALFTLVPLVLLHWSGALGDLLGGLSTAVGLGLYVLLWATTWWTNRRLLAATPFRRSNEWSVLKGSVKWGGVTGGLFFVELVVVALLQAAALGQLGAPNLGSVPVLVFVFILGTLVAFVVGSLVGVIQAGLDLLALRTVTDVLAAGSEQ